MVENNNLKPDWNYRKQVILNGQKIYTNKAELLSDLKSQNISLAIFKPSKLLDISFEEVEREWSREVLSAIKMRKNQISFFQNNTDLAKEIRLVKKVPYKIKIKFADDVGEPSNLMIEDWEIGALFWNCMKSSNNDEKVALQKVKEKYQKIFDEDDVYLFLGTTLEYHYRGRNPFIIIGIFHPPKDNQISFFDNFNYPENS